MARRERPLITVELTRRPGCGDWEGVHKTYWLSLCVEEVREVWEIPYSARTLWLTAYRRPGPQRCKVANVDTLGDIISVDGKTKCVVHDVGQVIQSLADPVYVEAHYSD